MTTFNYHYRPSTRKTRSLGTVFIRIIHERKSLVISTGYRVFPEEWDRYFRTVIVPHRSSRRHEDLKRIKDALDAGEADFSRIVSALAARGRYTIEDIRSVYHDSCGTGSLREYVEKVAAEISTRQPRTAQLYLIALRRLENFKSGHPIRISDINCRMMEGFQAHL